MNKIILATTSLYRKEALEFLGIDFAAEGSNIDESQVDRKNPEELVRQLSKLKAEVVARKYPEAIIIGMDSVGYFNGKILEKPKSKEEALERLKAVSGKSYEFFTGVYMINKKTRQEVTRVAKTEIFMRELSESEINKYLNEDPDYKRYAHGYDIKNKRSSSFVAGIKGSYNNALIGMPTEIISGMLSEVGYKK